MNGHMPDCRHITARHLTAIIAALLLLAMGTWRLKKIRSNQYYLLGHLSTQISTSPVVENGF
ncbi:UNVERIFIED_CONTAM: hypothetical protein NY100_09280 [Prevotella sp. 15_C9]